MTRQVLPENRGLELSAIAAQRVQNEGESAGCRRRIGKHGRGCPHESLGLSCRLLSKELALKALAIPVVGPALEVLAEHSVGPLLEVFTKANALHFARRIRRVPESDSHNPILGRPLRSPGHVKNGKPNRVCAGSQVPPERSWIGRRLGVPGLAG